MPGSAVQSLRMPGRRSRSAVLLWGAYGLRIYRISLCSSFVLIDPFVQRHDEHHIAVDGLHAPLVRRSAARPRST